MMSKLPELQETFSSLLGDSGKVGNVMLGAALMLLHFECLRAKIFISD